MKLFILQTVLFLLSLACFLYLPASSFTLFMLGISTATWVISLFMHLVLSKEMEQDYTPQLHDIEKDLRELKQQYKDYTEVLEKIMEKLNLPDMTNEQLAYLSQLVANKDFQELTKPVEEMEILPKKKKNN